MHVREMTDMDEITAFSDKGRRPSHILRHELPLTGYAVPPDVIEAIIRYYRIRKGNTITIGIASNLARQQYDFGQGERAVLERLELEEWLIHVAHDPFGFAIDEDDTEWAARKWALRAPYEELTVMLELLAKGPNAAIDEKPGDWEGLDCTLSLILTYWGQRDLPRFLEMSAPYMRAVPARSVLLMAFGELGEQTLPLLRPLIAEAAAWSEDDAELLADALFEIGGVETQDLLRSLRDLRPALAGYLERLRYV